MHELPAAPRELTGIQAARGIAALLVVLFHATGIVLLPKYWHAMVLGGMFSFGDAGVRFFFVLSGFIILWVHHGDIGRPARLWRYVRRRVVRVFPPYWIVLGLALVGNIAIGHAPGGALLLRSIFLVGTPPESLLAVGWTLFYEIFFYFLFSLLILSRSVGIAAMVLWVVLCIASAPLGYLTAPLNFLFVAGMASAAILQRYRIPMPAAMMWGGGMIFFAGGAFRVVYNTTSLPEFLYGVGSVMFVLGAVELERSGKLRAGRAARLLGDSSYSLYLSHYLVLSAAAKIFAPRMSALEGFLLIVLTAVAFGVAFHFMVEKPLLRLLRPRNPSVGN